ncbi:hypothetical protein ALC62_08603 [Cyphomyrmex costatus]|uniref:Uncharacterized protein n=1 Tax=Cyphomyrmex costatus TaxID=456900 RepID=A0A151IGN5_9HYME|nr:hypothetical protein ALC62_08603 [Cyphomyrmex costatus]
MAKPNVQKCSVPPRSNLLGSNDPAPMLPPLNPGSTARPLISSPVLAATTCTSVELVVKVPTRPAPNVPMRPAPPPPTSASFTKPQRPNSTPLINVILPEPEKNQHHKANKVIDKEILRNLEISNPIPQTEIEIATPVIPVIPVAEVEKRNVVLRAQSMRDSKVTSRPFVQTFGSMRQTTPVKRPTSIPASTRPTSPPPGPPNIAQTEKAAENTIKIPGLPGYQNPPAKTVQKPLENTYDDCMNLITESSLTKITEESPTIDNIYAVIEEPVPEKNKKNMELEVMPIDNEYKLPKRIDTIPGGPNSLESMGLLSEIVSEISNRNFNSIYSTSTLTRKKKEDSEEDATKNLENMGSNNSLGGYMNSNHYKIPGGIYSNSTSGKFNSSSSTTSSGYLHPSMINVPQVEKKEASNNISDANDNLKSVNSNLNTLKSNNPNINDELSKELGIKPSENSIGYKPFASTKTRSSHLIHIKKDDQTENKIPAKSPLNRTKTPPNIAKSPTSKDIPESSVKLARQSSDNTLKSSKFSKASNTSSTTMKQSSDANSIARQTQTNVSKSSSDLDKEESHTTVSVKNVPYSSKDNLEKFNSPDLVSSCSNSNQGGTKSPDVVGSNPKFNLSLKTVQKTPTLSRSGQKTPTTLLKPLNITSKTASLSERKKSPTGNASVTKSLSPSAKEANNDSTKPSHLTPKVFAKTEIKSGDTGTATRTNPLQRVASGKSNVASLQQKFEANKNSFGVARTISSANNKKPVARMTEVSDGGLRK